MVSSKRPISELLIGQDEAPARPETRRRLNDPTLPLTSPEAHRSPPPFQQPYQLLSFSYTSLPSPEDTKKHIRTLEWNNASMKYFVPPPQSANLAYGYERWIKRPEEKGRLDGLLEACSRSECEGERRRAGVVTWRGVVTKILTAPYEERDGWDLNVMCVGGTLYLEEHLSDDKLREKSNLTGHHRLMSYYGYAFESYCTSDKPPQAQGDRVTREANGWGGDVDTNVQWCSVVKTKLGSVRMIIGGEVDCVRGRNTGQPDTFVELKTSIAIRKGNKNDEAKFEKKMLKFYFQSFLLGVPEIIVGFRTPSGCLQTMQSFKTMDLPRQVRGKPGAWDPAVCLSWGARVVDFLRNQISDRDGEEDVWRVSFTPGVGLLMRHLERDDVEDVQAGEDRVGFLPRWYWERIQIPPESHDDGLRGAGSEIVRPTTVTGSQADATSNTITREPVQTVADGPRAAKVQGWQV